MLPPAQAARPVFSARRHLNTWFASPVRPSHQRHTRTGFQCLLCYAPLLRYRSPRRTGRTLTVPSATPMTA